MTDTEVFLLIILAVTDVGMVIVTMLAYREGWQYGYEAGYDDRDDETLYDDKPGTRRGRTAL